MAAKSTTNKNITNTQTKTDINQIANGNTEVLIVLMDIRNQIALLVESLDATSKHDLSLYEIWLQNAKKMEPNQSLADDCYTVNGIVQVNVEINNDFKRLNILDIVQPSEEMTRCTEQKNGNDTDAVMNEVKGTTFCLLFFYFCFIKKYIL